MWYMDRESEQLLMWEALSVASFFLGNYLLALGSIHSVFIQGDNFWEIVVMFVKTFFCWDLEKDNLS
jgi:hypothetical protein